MFIDHDPRSVDDDDIDIDWIVERAEDAVLRYGIDCLVIDPWNELDHCREAGESETDYTNRAIRCLKRLSHSYDIAVIVVAHPTKLAKDKSGKILTPTPYDIAGSASWFNKPDHVVMLDRDENSNTRVNIQKSRHDFAGRKGDVSIRWNAPWGRYEEIPAETLAELQEALV